MTGGECAAVSIAVALRRPCTIDIRAPLARALLGDGKPRGLGRLRRKAAAALFGLVHRRLGIAAPALLTPAGAAGGFVVDCRNTGFLDYARRSRAFDGFEPELAGLFTHLAGRLGTVYDIGANWGYYPLMLGTDPRFGGAVEAFEVAPRTAEDLRRVVAGAGLGRRVRVHGFGLSDRDGTAFLRRTRHSYLAGIAESGDPVAVRRLDSLALPPPDLIKIDVEGHEAAVLRGGLDLIARHRPLIFLESWYRPDDAAAMLAPIRLLAGLGYRFFRPLWRRRGEGGHGTIALQPFDGEARGEIRATFNLVACHAARAADYFPR